MCQSCQTLALDNRERYAFNERQRSHTNKRKPTCEYPETCTCQHRHIDAPRPDGWYLHMDGVS